MKGGKSASTAALILVACLAVGLAVFSLLPFLAPIKVPFRHVDPNAEQERSPFPFYMFTLVRNAFDSLNRGNYTAMVEELSTLSLVYVPEKYRFIVNRFRQLINDAAERLNETERLLDGAESLVMMGRGEEAKLVLGEASEKLASAKVTYNELRRASEELAKTFNLPTGEIQSRVDMLGKVIEELYARLLRLWRMIEEQAVLEDTFLQIDVEPKTVWTGSTTRVEGWLTAADEALAGRTVKVYVEGLIMAEAVTSVDGGFAVVLNLPYVYVPRVAVQACYVPQGSDADAYKPSASNIVMVELLYIQPHIRVETVRLALPGKTFLLKGCIEAERPIPYSNVTVSWAGTTLAAKLTDTRFETSLYTPSSLVDGEYALTVETPAWQIYAPTKATAKVKVERLPLTVNVQAPSVVLAGLTSNIKGFVVYGDERFNVSVKAVFAGQGYAVNSSGEFEAGFATPLSVLTGYRDYEVFVEPELPWYSGYAFKGSILVVNPLTFIVPVGFASFLAAGFLKGKRKDLKPVAVFEEPEAQRSGVVKGYSVAEGLQWLIDSYWQAVALVSEMTGVAMKPSMTLREFFEAARSGLGSLEQGFRALTFAVEKALYARTVSSEELENARKTVLELKVGSVEVQL